MLQHLVWLYCGSHVAGWWQFCLLTSKITTNRIFFLSLSVYHFVRHLNYAPFLTKTLVKVTLFCRITLVCDCLSKLHYNGMWPICARSLMFIFYCKMKVGWFEILSIGHLYISYINSNACINYLPHPHIV